MIATDESTTDVHTRIYTQLDPCIRKYTIMTSYLHIHAGPHLSGGGSKVRAAMSRVVSSRCR